MTGIAFVVAVIALVVAVVATGIALIALGIIAHRHPIPPAPKPTRVNTTHVLSGSTLEDPR